MFKNIDVFLWIMNKEKGNDEVDKNSDSQIDESMTKDCIFCKIVKGEIPSTKVFEDDNLIGILDINGKAEGHTLVIPKKHFRSILDCPNTLGNEYLAAIKKVGLKLIEEKKGNGFNVIFNTEKVAGQAVFHVHAHVIPRNEGDGLDLF